MSFPVIVFANVRKPTWCAIEAIGDDHAILHNERAYLLAHAMRKLRPFSGHPHIRLVVPFLLQFLVVHRIRKMIFLLSQLLNHVPARLNPPKLGF